MKTKAEDKKPSPKRCVCGSDAITVRFRGKKMVSCPNPERCIGNLRTRWYGQELSAVLEWNNLVDSFEYTKR